MYTDLYLYLVNLYRNLYLDPHAKELVIYVSICMWTAHIYASYVNLLYIYVAIEKRKPNPPGTYHIGP